MANTWGELGWSVGQWGLQNDATVALTGFGLNISEGQANYTPGEGWGRFTWGSLGWGVNYANENVSLTGLSIKFITR
jgi:hypothetical protein